MPSLRPTKIVVDSAAQTLDITWSDSRACSYPLDGLRRACPCATCQGHGRDMTTVDPAILREPPRRRWEALRLEAAGTVGLRITWDDGHDTGIWTWERLRTLCA